MVSLNGDPLKQKFDIDLWWAPDRDLEKTGQFAQSAAPNPPDVAPGDPAAGIFTAIRKSLGLRLQPHKQHVEFLVVDRLEHFPVSN